MEPPKKPDESDCCNSGCNPCVFDVYEKQLKKYEEYLQNPDCNIGKIAYKNCIDQCSYSIFEVVNILKHTPSSYIYTFKYKKSSRDVTSGNDLPIKLFYTPGQHFLIRAKEKCSDNYFTRAYTPIPNDSIGDHCSFTILIKIYKNGLMSDYIKNLSIGDETFWRGPYGDFCISLTFKHILFIAQGTGIAPLYSIIDNLVKNENCDTFLKLLFCCRNSDEILLHEELYRLCSYWNFTYELFLNSDKNVNPKYNEVIHCKKISESDLKLFLSTCSEETQVLICGNEDFNSCIKTYVVNCKVPIPFIYTF